MNRTEALRILGLDDDATPEDVKTAYKETVQILHPDRFASNKKLQDRATEQFKNLQEAYDYLTSGKGSRTSARDPRAAAERARSYTSSNQVEARMAGVAAARTQLVKQRDVALDERRNGIAMTAIGGIVALIAGRRPFGLFGIVAAIASAAAVWGIVQVCRPREPSPRSTNISPSSTRKSAASPRSWTTCSRRTSPAVVSPYRPDRPAAPALSPETCGIQAENAPFGRQSSSAGAVPAAGPIARIIAAPI